MPSSPQLLLYIASPRDITAGRHYNLPMPSPTHHQPPPPIDEKSIPLKCNGNCFTSSWDDPLVVKQCLNSTPHLFAAARVKWGINQALRALWLGTCLPGSGVVLTTGRDGDTSPSPSAFLPLTPPNYASTLAALMKHFRYRPISNKTCSN